MPVDLSRVAGKAIEAALDDGEQHRRRGSAVRALAAGAVLAVGARAAMSKTPGPVKFGLKHLPGISELRDLPERLRERMADAGRLDDETDVEEPQDAYEDEEPAAETEEDFDEPDEEEADDEELDDEEDDLEPEDEAEEDFEESDEDLEEPEDEEEDFDEDDEEEPEDEEPPELELESEDDEDLHPEDRPPRPPRRSKSTSRR